MPEHFPLDLQDLKPIDLRSRDPKEISFHTEYCRVAEETLERHLQEAVRSGRLEEALRSHRILRPPLGKDTSISVVAPVLADTLNWLFDGVRSDICSHMHAFLLQQKGAVCRWADDLVPTFLTFEQKPGGFYRDAEDYSCFFRYFCGGFAYSSEQKKIRQKGEKLVYRNAYQYGRPAPENVRTREQEAVCSRKTEEYEKSVKREYAGADKALQQACDLQKARRSACFAMLVALLFAVVLALPCLQGIRPFFLTFSNSFRGFYSPLIARLDGLPELLQTALSVLAFIPLVLTFIVLWCFAALCVIMELLYGLSGTAYGIGCGVLGVIWLAAVLLLNHQAPFKAAFVKNRVQSCRQKFREAKEKLEQLEQTKARMVQQFHDSEAYRNARRLDEQDLQEYLADKAVHEDFAERWQRAWFEAVCADAQAEKQ